jgi:alginate O-acetyltransferase complex protein AlgI
MLFNSFEFLLFFPLVSIIYFGLAHKYRWLHLLLASCVFYCFFIPKYLLILLFTIIIDYFAGIWIEESKGKNKKIALIISLLANIGVLAVFKYCNFIILNTNIILKATGNPPYELWDIILPIGLSFHTFQAMSYTIEVYRNNQKAERHFGIYALYVMFYPQLVAGPIERPQNILHQFYEKHNFNFQNAKSGLRLMLWGMFKKVVIADRLGVFVDYVYNNPEQHKGLPLMLATLFFSIQIFCDFSGYSDIAIGAARFMGFDLMKNFDRPYSSKNISEFWKRWHISLSTWFRDYIYIPLGGNRVRKSRNYFNLFVVFMVSGLWHGSAWNYVIWGALHGIYLIFGQITAPLQKKIFAFIPSKWFANRIEQFITIALISFAWIFFRANSISKIKYILLNIFKESSMNITEVINHIGILECILIVVSFCILEAVHAIQSKKQIGQFLDQMPKWKQWSIYYGFLILVVFFGVYAKTQFIYFQF